MRHLGPALALSLITLSAVPASAHIQMLTPMARNTEQKKAPCGLDQGVDMKGDPVATFMPGETIVVVWEETINHPAHYRISLDLDGQDDFADPAAMDDYYTNSAVLLDEIPDKNGGMYMAEVTLPDMECDTCTLQLIQVMYDKPPFGDGNDMYYQCADIAIKGMGVDTTGTTDATTTGGTTDATTGGDTSTSGGTTGETTGGSTAGSTSGSSAGSSSSGGSTTGSTAGSGDSSGSATDSSGGGDGDGGGCGCTQSGGGSIAWAAPLLLAFAGRRRRRCG